MSQRTKRILLTALHSLWMIFLVFFWMWQPFISNKEFGLTKKLVMESDKYRLKKDVVKKKYLEQFFFINTSHSLMAYDDAPHDWNSNVITDRAQLLSIFKKLEKNKELFNVAFLDVYIDELRSDSLGNSIDTELAELIKRLKKDNKVITVSNVSDFTGNTVPVTIPGTEDVDRVLTNQLVYDPNIFGEDLSGTAYYPPSLGKNFYKFQYQMEIDGKEIKQAPMMMYELATKEKAGKPFLLDLFYRYDNEPGIFQNITIPRMKLNNSDLKKPILLKNSEGDEMEKPMTVNMNLLYDEDETLLEDIMHYFPGQFIIIGDMNFIDNHGTTGGTIAGPVIVANTLITLFEEENKLHFLYFVFLFIAFAAVSWLTFYPEVMEKLKEKKFKYKAVKYLYDKIVGKLNYYILFLTAIIGLLLFKSYIYFFFSLFYVYLITQARFYWNLIKEKCLSKKAVKP